MGLILKTPEAAGAERDGHSGIRTLVEGPTSFPDRISIVRLVGAVLAEQHDEWADGRRYLGLDVLAKSRLTLITTTADKEEANTDAVGAISA